ISNSILFGFSAIRNLGHGAINCILKARETGGEFKALADLCDRVDLRTLNRRGLEALIYCGAFDSIQPNRQQLIKDLEPVISWGQDRAKDRESGQLNIFDFGNTNSEQDQNNNAWESAPTAPAVSDFSRQEKLNWEKELLGFYVSDHPLKSARPVAQVLSPVSLAELGDQKKGTTLSAIVMLTEVKPHLTKKNNERMAFVQMEDLTGQAEGVVFPKTYEKISSLLQADSRLIIWAKVDERDEKIQLIIEDAELIESLRKVVVKLTSQQVTTSHLNQLKSILQKHSGKKHQAKIPVLATVAAPQQYQFVRFDSKYWVQDDQVTVNALKASGFDARTDPVIRS
ncbi:MAG: trans-splicing intein-formed DNA polymerase III subunit alpha C-terminal partner DnaE-C, partial [Moorea sp. SIO3G5]|nr:trans-splicing intein-formed DNA polymerase III subunit alpha C-terminal partner DnaE-C [Moorena sp. SIO3G5]